MQKGQGEKIRKKNHEDTKVTKKSNVILTWATLAVCSLCPLWLTTILCASAPLREKIDLGVRLPRIVGAEAPDMALNVAACKIAAAVILCSDVDEYLRA
jgi:hypothetical protein